MQVITEILFFAKAAQIVLADNKPIVPCMAPLATVASCASIWRKKVRTFVSGSSLRSFIEPSNFVQAIFDFKVKDLVSNWCYVEFSSSSHFFLDSLPLSVVPRKLKPSVRCIQQISQISTQSFGTSLNGFYTTRAAVCVRAAQTFKPANDFLLQQMRETLCGKENYHLSAHWSNGQGANDGCSKCTN